jgi:hypothetical protein
VCRFHVAASAGSAPCQKPVRNNLQKWFLSPTGRLNFGFITKGKLTVVLITPSSWGSQLVVNHAPLTSATFLMPSPMQPPGTETEVDLGGSLGYMLLWPKDMLRLDHPGTASNLELPVGSTLQSNPIIASTSTSQKLAEPVGSVPSQRKATMLPVVPSPIADDPAANDPIEPMAQNNMDPLDALIADFEGPFEVDVPDGCLLDQ